jgi:hypothetical protein
MFFAESLGPDLTPGGAAVLVKQLKKQLGGRSSVTVAEFHKAITDNLRRTGSGTKPALILAYLERCKLLSIQGKNVKFK